MFDPELRTRADREQCCFEENTSFTAFKHEPVGAAMHARYDKFLHPIHGVLVALAPEF